jgi:ribose transport system permease protein
METPARPPAKTKEQSTKRWEAVSAGVALALVVVLVVLFSALVPGFRSLSLGLSIGVSWWLYALLVLGLTLVMTTGRMDLSGASVAALAGAVSAKLAVLGVPLLLGLLPAALLAAVIGAVNGLVATVSRPASFIGTLATAAVCQALTVQLLGAPVVTLPRGAEELTPLIVPAVLLAIAAAALALIALVSPAGDMLRRLGREHEPVTPARMLTAALIVAYAAAAVLAAGAGVGEVARTGAASPGGVAQTEVAVIAAAILGGASLRGGRGAGIGAIVAALAVTVVLFGLGAVPASPAVSAAMMGLLLIAVLVWDELRGRASLPEPRYPGVKRDDGEE